MQEYLDLLIVLVMVAVNGVFASYEIALASVSVSKLQLLIDERRAGAKAALSMKQGIEKSLAVVQLGITLVGLIAGATGGATATSDIAPVLRTWGMPEGLVEPIAIAVVVLPLTVLTIVVGELVPKLFALRNKEWVCLKLSPMMWGFSVATWPAVWVLEASASTAMSTLERLWKPGSTADARAEAAEIQELRAIVSLARTSRLIGSREENIILGAARLASRKLREIALPAEHIRSLPVNQNLTEGLLAAHLDMHTRFPVVEREGDPQSIVGYVTFKDIVSALRLGRDAPSMRAIVRSIPSLRDELAISEALELLLRQHTHIALVRGVSGEIVGMITLEDIVEELLGDINDEYDLLPSQVVSTSQGWVVGGGATLSRIREAMGIESLWDDGTTTISNWVIDRLGRTPLGGEIVIGEGMRVMVRKVRRQRVLEAFVDRATQRELDKAEGDETKP